MQVPPLPVPVAPNALPTEAAKTVPHVQAQASVPVTQRAIDPSPKSERGNKTRSNGDRAKGGKGSDTDKRGGSVNLRV